MADQKPGKNIDMQKVNEAIGLVCNRHLGVLDSSFLCQSLGVLCPTKPLSVVESCLVGEALNKLREARVGCLIVVGPTGDLVGIFSERDCMLKVVHDFARVSALPISEVMTRDPVTQTVEATIGFALTLMSEGGFRHLPLLDQHGKPTGIVSVKDVMDFIVKRLVDDLLAFPIAEG